MEGEGAARVIERRPRVGEGESRRPERWGGAVERWGGGPVGRETVRESRDTGRGARGADLWDVLEVDRAPSLLLSTSDKSSSSKKYLI